MKGGGIRLGSPSVTTRGMREPEMEQIGAWIAEILSNIGNAEIEQRVRKQVANWPRNSRSTKPVCAAAQPESNTLVFSPEEIPNGST